MNSRDYQHLYNNQRWRRVSKAQLAREPLCADCLQRGIITPASEADHVQPHKGDPDLFWCGQLQSLCKPCHSYKTVCEQGKCKKATVDVTGAPVGW